MKGILRRYGLPALCVAALYAGNRLFLIPHTTGVLHRLLAWHFADFLAGGLMLCVLNAGLELSGRRLWGGCCPSSAFPFSAAASGNWLRPCIFPTP